MIIDLNRYRINIPYIKYLLEPCKTEEERLALIRSIAISSHCPIIAVCHYYGEIYGYSEELNHMIKRLCDYYKVSDVVGQVKK